MATNDPFSAQLAALVRNMPDEALVELVRGRLGGIVGAPVATGAPATAPTPAPARRRGRPPRAAAPPAPPAKAPVKKEAPKRRPGRPRKTAALSAERQETLNTVERIVKGSSGVSASEVARQAGIPQTRAAAALKELKLAKRIAQGGDRRFARYAGDAKTAEQASLNARKTASGPATAAGASAPAAAAPAKKAAAKPRKRSAPAAAASK
jgi:hypothetical protein